jgi:hypothetical protein
MRVPNSGRPVMKARVPSIGSSTQSVARVDALEPVLLAVDAVRRHLAREESHASPPRIRDPRS